MDHLYFEQIIPEEFCDYVVGSMPWADSYNGTIQGFFGDKRKETVRKADVLGAHLMTPIGCVCQSYLASYIGITGWTEKINSFDDVQLIRYTEGGHYKWHNDVNKTNDGKVRKLTLVMLLNDPSEFDGGQLQIKGVDSDNVLKNKGDIVIFKSELEHRVLPVTDGVRYVAVCWAKGPKE